jgi:phosphoserine/homoserine phosphotransferase
MYLVCSDLEGVWVPEVWVNVAEKTGIEELKLTTRDISDYDVLMKHRLKLLNDHKLTLKDIQNVISTIKPIEGAIETINWIKERCPFILVSDTFVEFADPLMRQLNRPTLFCNSLVINSQGQIIDYKLRQKEQKKKVAQALKSLNYTIIGIGDSYNDINMLKESDYPLLIHPPQKVKDDYPELTVINNYNELKQKLSSYLG